MDYLSFALYCIQSDEFKCLIEGKITMDEYLKWKKGVSGLTDGTTACGTRQEDGSKPSTSTNELKYTSRAGA